MSRPEIMNVNYVETALSLSVQGAIFLVIVGCFLWAITECFTNNRVLKPIAITTVVVSYLGLFFHWLILIDGQWSWDMLAGSFIDGVHHGVILMWAFIGFFSSFTVLCFVGKTS